MPPTLVTTRYVPAGSYIGQLIVPRPGAVSGEARLPCYIGRGSRHAVGRNIPLRRAYVSEETLDFSRVAPFRATLSYKASIDQSVARLYKSDGSEVRLDQWNFVNDQTIQVNSEIYDANASYKLDYQSVDRSVPDPIPVDEVREIMALGTTTDQAEFKEFQHFYLSSTVSTPGPKTSSSVANTGRTIGPVKPHTGNTGTGTVSVDGSASYEHDYNRYYELEVTAVSGTTGSYQATFAWSSMPVSGGNGSLPPVPLHSSAVKPSFIAKQTTPASLVVELEHGVKVAVGFVATNFAVGDRFELNALGPALIEKDARYANTNQFPSVTRTSNVFGTGLMDVVDAYQYDGAYNSKIDIKCTAASGASPNRTATFVWAMYGDYLRVGGTFTITEGNQNSLTQTLTMGVKMACSWSGALTNFAVDDSFTVTCLAPREYYQGKDDRTYTLTLTGKSVAMGEGHVEATYVTNTPEGRYGTFASDATFLPPNDPDAADGHVVLPQNVLLAFRNMFAGPATDVTPGNRFTVGDVFQFVATNDDQIMWDLNEVTEETIALTDILTDVTGVVTGAPNTKYVILKKIPVELVYVKDASNNHLSYTLINDSAHIWFATAPTTAVTVGYFWRSQEPDPGQIYYLTAKYLRPDELYNSPQLILDRDAGRTLLAPSEPSNHLYIMNEAAWDNDVPGCYFIQVKDADSDGIYTNNDFSAAILASEASSRITDICVLGNYGSMADTLASLNKMNDPFARRERLGWFGCPTGTAIGDESTQDTLIYLARKTLQVYGNNPAHGTRIICGHTKATREIQLEDKSTYLATVDGSFIAGSLAALCAAFTDPSETILRKTLAGWKSIDTYGEKDSPTNIRLGNAGIIYLENEGNSVFRIHEDISVDTFAEDFKLINNMTQKQFMTRFVRSSTDASLVSIVVPSAAAGVGLVKGFLVQALTNAAGKYVGRYQDENGNDRELDVDKDVIVFRDSNDSTLYHYLYAY